MKEILGHLEFAKVLGISALGTILFTIFMAFIAKKSRVIRYIPGVLLIIFALYNLIFLGDNFFTTEEINRLYLVMLGMISGIIGLSTALIIGIIKKGRD